MDTERRERLLNAFTAETQDKVADIVDAVLWQAEKIKQAQELIGDDSVAVEYVNGSQTGIHENPAFTGYHKLCATYLSMFDKMMALADRADSEALSEVLDLEKELAAKDGK